ncbi:MAG: hypothetical protein QOG10_7159 [Kribbellaceae bacterium]|jgi:hypothetical protein|nr:hypothetical protein [Kribbellaceae bacterium]
MTNASITTVISRLHRGRAATTRPGSSSRCQRIRHTGADGGMISDRKCPSAYSAARRLIASLVCSLAFLLVVAVATWIVINAGAGHPTWQ